MAADGQTLATQTPQVQAAFNAAYGAGAAQQWDSQHNAAIGGGAPPPDPTKPQPNPNDLASIPAANATISAADVAVRAASQRAQQAFWEAQAQGWDKDRTEKAMEFAATQELAKYAQGLAAQQQAYTQGMGVLNLAASLQGPANAFTQQAVLHGLNANGLSRSVDALNGTVLPTFQAPQATPQAASLSSLVNQISPGSGQAVGSTPAIPSVGQIMSGTANWTGAPSNTTAPGATASAAGLSGNALTAYQVLTANNGSPAAGLSQDVFQAYMNTHNGALPPDAYGLAQWAQQNPQATAANTAQVAAAQPTITAPSAASGSAGQRYGAASPSGFQNGMQAADGTWYDAAMYPNGPPTSNVTTGMGMNENTGPTPVRSGAILGPLPAGTPLPGGGVAGGGATTADYVNALPPPNKIVSRSFNGLDPDSQAFDLAAYRQAGYSDNDVLNTVKATLPQFRAPSAGSIAA